jgi:hypothetical protein
LHSQNQVQIFNPDDPLLVSLVHRLKREVLKSRAYYQTQLDTVNTILDSSFAHHKDLTDNINDLKRRIQLLTKGAPATESIEATDTVTDSHQHDVAQAFLLKKAYRQAAAMSHPDKGGSNEDFAAVNAAYKAKDLGSLNEYVIARNKTLLEQIAFWRTEAFKPEARWHKVRSQPEFLIVQLTLSGQKPKAIKMAREVLEVMVVSLTMQLTNYQPEKELTHV